MKNYFVLLFSVISICVYSQNRFETDSIKAYSYIEKEIKNRKLTTDEILSIFDDSGKIIIIWLEKERYKAIKIYYKGQKTKYEKNKRQKLSRENKIIIENIFKNPNIISELLNSDCNESVHSFNRVSLRICNKNNVYYGSFFTHCKQIRELSSIMLLYFNLKK